MKRFSDIVTIFLALALLPKALSLALPFVLGFVIYLCCRRPVRRMVRAGLNRSLAAGLALGFCVALSAGALALIPAAAYGQWDRLPNLLSRLSALEGNSPLLSRVAEALRDEAAGALKTLSLGLLAHMGDITEIFMTGLFAVLSAFFFLRDDERLVDIIVRNGGGGFIKNVRSIRAAAGSALSGYIRAQAVLMVITFGLLSLFLVLLGVKNAVLIALGTALLDAVPVFGTGFVLIPWALWSLLTGSVSLGFGLLALYGVCSLTRQILEPKILSSHIGLHPLLTLTGIFVGYRLLGLAGLVLGPAAMLVIVTYIQKSR